MQLQLPAAPAPAQPYFLQPPRSAAGPLQSKQSPVSGAMRLRRMPMAACQASSAQPPQLQMWVSKCTHKEPVSGEL